MISIPILAAFVLNLLTAPKEGFPAPPGTVQFDDSTFIDIQLISVTAYEEFLFFLKYGKEAIPGIAYQACLPDSTIFYGKKPYLSTKRYKKEFPILNLTPYQIDAYCKWRSYAVSLMKNNPGQRTCNFEFWDVFDKADPAALYKIEYSLPDSTVLASRHFFKQMNIGEKCRGGLCKVSKQDKRFGAVEVFGFRCVARYVLR